MRTDHNLWKGWAFVCLVACLLADLPSAQGALRATYGGRAVVLDFANDNEFSGFEPVVIGDTGLLAPNGKAKTRVLRSTNIATVIRFSSARASVRGVQQQTIARVNINNFTLVISPPGQTSHTLHFDRMIVTATARCGRTNAFTRSQVQFEGLTLDGHAVEVTGEPNQALGFPGGLILLNAQPTDEETAPGSISVAGIFVSLDDDVSGPIGLAEAAVECVTVPDPVCERTAGTGLILDRSRNRLGQLSFAATRQGNRLQGFLNFYDYRSRQRIRSARLENYEILPDRTRQLTYSVNLNDGTATTITVLAMNLRQRGLGADRVSVSSTDGNYEASGNLLNGSLNVRRVSCR